MKCSSLYLEVKITQTCIWNIYFTQQERWNLSHEPELVWIQKGSSPHNTITDLFLVIVQLPYFLIDMSYVVVLSFLLSLTWHIFQFVMLWFIKECDRKFCVIRDQIKLLCCYLTWKQSMTWESFKNDFLIYWLLDIMDLHYVGHTDKKVLHQIRVKDRIWFFFLFNLNSNLLLFFNYMLGVLHVLLKWNTRTISLQESEKCIRLFSKNHWQSFLRFSIWFPDVREYRSRQNSYKFSSGMSKFVCCSLTLRLR